MPLHPSLRLQRLLMSCVLFLLLLAHTTPASGGAPMARVPFAPKAAPADGPRCTDATVALAGADTAYTDFAAYASELVSTTLHLQLPTTTNPVKPDAWRVLIRGSQPFAVFYNIGGAQPLNDLDATGHLYDDDTDGVPDFVERAYNCLVEANARYQSYYTPSTDEYAHLQWMPIRYGTGHVGRFYPVFLQPEGARGWVEPWLFRALRNWELQLPTSRDSATYMNLDSSGTYFERGSGPWLYPRLEHTIYHEVFHVYQGFYKKIEDLWDLADHWIYEGTAVYASDQMLLPPCPGSELAPPRIPLLAGSLPTCRAPDINERDSETRLSTSPRSNAIFDQPWVGLRSNQDVSPYSSVLFWYYAQTYFQGLPDDSDTDILRHFWRKRNGTEQVVYDWAATRYSGGLGDMYHRFMIANYLQDLPYPASGYDNPYYRPWPTATGPFVNPPPVMQVGVDDRKSTELNAPRFFFGNDGDPTHTIDTLGTRYYVIEPDPSAPITATLEVDFRLEDVNLPDAYQVTFLDVTTPVSGLKPTAVHSVMHIDPHPGAKHLFRVPNFGSHAGAGQIERVVVVVSKVEDTGTLVPFTIQASLTDKDTQPVAAPNPFSPNGDERKDASEISYFLPLFPSPYPPNDNTYQVDVDVMDAHDTSLFHPVARVTQPMSQTQVFTWTGRLDDGTPLADGAYALRFQAYEAPGGMPTGQLHTYTTTVAIDTQPPSPVRDLLLTPGSVTDTLSWTSVTTDTSPGGLHYLVFNTAHPITDTNSIEPTAIITDTSYSFAHIPARATSRWWPKMPPITAAHRCA